MQVAVTFSLLESVASTTAFRADDSITLAVSVMVGSMGVGANNLT